MRNQGWEIEIEDYLQKISQKSFRWGECDCLIMVSDAAKIICNKDPMSRVFPEDPETIRGLYFSEEEAKFLISQYRKSMPFIMDALFKRVDPVFAGRGDIVLQNIDGQHVFGLVWSKGKAFFKTQEPGLRTESAYKARLAWKVE